MIFSDIFYMVCRKIDVPFVTFFVVVVVLFHFGVPKFIFMIVVDKCYFWKPYELYLPLREMNY